jgi:signal transduction histidine kinase
MVCEHQQDLSPNHTITSDLDGLPGMVVADGNAIEQVFTNLLSNAVKYSPHAPHIRVEGWQRDGHAYVSVRDHGLGIDEDELPHMFKRFFRAKTAAGIAGTGIGLDLSRKLVEAHGGTVSVESRASVGSVFTVKLPTDGIAASATLTDERAVGGSAR